MGWSSQWKEAGSVIKYGKAHFQEQYLHNGSEESKQYLDMIDSSDLKLNQLQRNMSSLRDFYASVFISLFTG